MPGRDQKAQVSINLIKAWKEADNRGISSDICDRLVSERDAPDKLVGAIFSLITEPRCEKLLTPQERRCLSLISFGWRPAAVAGFLNIKLWTVRSHIRKAKFKLNTTTTAEAVAKAFRMKEIL